MKTSKLLSIGDTDKQQWISVHLEVMEHIRGNADKSDFWYEDDLGQSGINRKVFIPANSFILPTF